MIEYRLIVRAVFRHILGSVLAHSCSVSESLGRKSYGAALIFNGKIGASNPRASLICLPVKFIFPTVISVIYPASLLSFIFYAVKKPCLIGLKIGIQILYFGYYIPRRIFPCGGLISGRVGIPLCCRCFQTGQVIIPYCPPSRFLPHWWNGKPPVLAPRIYHYFILGGVHCFAYLGIVCIKIGSPVFLHFIHRHICLSYVRRTQFKTLAFSTALTA